MNKLEIFSEQNLSTTWLPLSISGMRGIKNLVLQARASTDILLTTKPISDDSLGYFTLKAGTSISIDLGGRPMGNDVNPESCLDGDFAAADLSTNWNPHWVSGVGDWSRYEEVVSGVVIKVGALYVKSGAVVSLDNKAVIIPDFPYHLVYVLDEDMFNTGQLTPSIGGTEALTATTFGTYDEWIYTQDNSPLSFLPVPVSAAAEFMITSVSLKRCALTNILFAKASGSSAVLEIMALL